jgi:hypothetical protein
MLTVLFGRQATAKVSLEREQALQAIAAFAALSAAAVCGAFRALEGGAWFGNGTLPTTMGRAGAELAGCF